MTDFGTATTTGRSGAAMNDASATSAARHTMINRVHRGALGLLVAVAVTMAAPASAPVGAQAAWENVTGNLAHKMSECGTLTLLSAVPGSGTIIAGVALRGLWANTDGTTWTQLGTGPGSVRITNRASWITYDPTNPAIFWQSGIYGDNGIYRTADGGRTFQRIGSLANDYVSVDFADPERRTVLAGGHERAQTVQRSVDGGKTWTNVGENLPPGYGATTHPFVTNAGTFLANAQGPGGRGGGIFRSTDSGLTWEQVSIHGPMAPPLISSSGIIYWAADGYIVRSLDSGLTWKAAGRGLSPIRPAELPDRRIVAVGSDELIDRLWVSADRGETWARLGPPLPYRPDGIIYSPARKAFFIWRGDCREQVPGNAVMKLDFEVSVPETAGQDRP